MHMPLTSSYLTGPALVEKALEAQEKWPITAVRWRGSSSYLYTGAEVAVHLEAAAEWMENQPGENGPGCVVEALRFTKADDVGEDASYVAEKVVALVLMARTGAAYVAMEQWARHPRTGVAEAVEVFRAAAGLARAIGPTSV